MTTDDCEIQLSNRLRVAQSGLLTIGAIENPHERRAATLVYGLALEQARYADEEDEYGECISDPDHQEFEVHLDGRTFTVKIEET